MFWVLVDLYWELVVAILCWDSMSSFITHVNYAVSPLEICSQLQVRMLKLEVRIVMRWVSTDSTQSTFPAFVDSEKF